MKNDRIWHFLLDYYACLEQSVTLPLVLCQNVALITVHYVRIFLLNTF